MDKGNEKKGPSAVDVGNKAIDATRYLGRGNKALGTVRTLATAAQGAGALAFNPAGAVVLAFAFMFVATIVIVFLFGGAPVAVGGDLSNNSTNNPSSTSGQCFGTCRNTCLVNEVPDTEAKSCSNSSNPICCVSQPPPGVQPQVHFYCQYDPSYSDCKVTYAANNTCSNNNCDGKTTCDLIRNGCTPTSIAMILASYGKKFNPRTTALSLPPGPYANGNGCTCGGTFAGKFASLLDSQGLKFYGSVNIASGKNFNISLAQKFLSKGCFLTAAADMHYNEGWGSHQTVITAISSDGIITDYDPTYCKSDANTTNPRTFSVFDTGVINDWLIVTPICQK